MNLAVSTAWNARRHAGWAPAAREILDAGARRIALDGAALHADATETARVVREAHGTIDALFAPAAPRDTASPVDEAGLVDLRADRRAVAVAQAVAAGRAALAAGTRVVVLRPGTIPVVDGAREDRWNERLGREGVSDALRDDVAAARRELRTDRPRFVEALCRSVWAAARALPDVVWCVESPSSVAGVPFPEEIEGFLGELRGRRVALWLDAAHAARLGLLGAADPAAWIDRACGAVHGVTVSDWSPPVFGACGRTPPGAGVVDWAALRGQLSAATMRVLRLPPEVPPGLVADALRDAGERVG